VVNKIIILTGQYESDESKQPVAAPEDEARENDVSDVRRDLLHNNWMLLLSGTDHDHLSSRWLSVRSLSSWILLRWGWIL